MSCCRLWISEGRPGFEEVVDPAVSTLLTTSDISKGNLGTFSSDSPGDSHFKSKNIEGVHFKKIRAPVIIGIFIKI